MQQLVISVTPAGTTGSASATGTATIFYSGELYAVYLDAVATTAGTQMRITQNYAPSLTLLTVNATADGWYFPRNGLHDNSGSSTSGTAPYPVTGELAFSVSTSVPSAHTAYIYIREQ